MTTNLGLLFLFKYYGFFLESFVGAFRSLGVEMNVPTLHLVLPVGISFYTFQTLSYTIDVYRRQLEPATDMVSFFCLCGVFSAVGRRSY